MSEAEEFWRPEIQHLIPQVERNPSMAVDLLGPLISEGRAVSDHAFCSVHKKMCRLRGAKRHIAGTSCVGFSQKGTGLMLSDPSIIHTLCWVALRLLLAEPDVTQENVTRCPVDLFARFMQKDYYIDVTKMDSVQFGIAAARERQFIRFRHRAKIQSELSPLSMFMKRFFRAVEYSWKEHFFMMKEGCQQKGITPNEPRENLEWAAGRPTSHAQSLSSALALGDPMSFRLALTGTEWLGWNESDDKFLCLFYISPFTILQCTYGSTSQQWLAAIATDRQSTDRPRIQIIV